MTQELVTNTFHDSYVLHIVDDIVGGVQDNYDWC
jgi:hypothetical protein